MTEENEHRIFGTDGARGRANIFPMTVETALALGKATGKMFQFKHGKHRVVVGKDTRISCYMFENALISGLCSVGIDALMVGTIPTPAIAFITRSYRADAGIVISASHNPYYDNGIKFFSSEGYKLPDYWEKEIEEYVLKGDFSDIIPPDDLIGRNFKVIDAYGRYIEFAKSTFPKGMTLEGIKIVLDCANGAAYKVAPLIFQELDATVYVYGNEPNGLNINLECGSLFPQLARKSVIEHSADVGIALDGDGDRVIMIDEKAQIINGDIILAICAKDLAESGKLKNNRVVCTVMANYGFLEMMKGLGIEVIQSDVGDRHVIREMMKHDANLGGEQSGHIIFSDHNTTGDGIVAALQVLKIMKKTGAKLSELSAFVKQYPQVTINVPIASKPPIKNLIHVDEIMSEIQREMNGEGRVLIRYSGTEMVCRIMVEGTKSAQIQNHAEALAHAIDREIGIKK